ncbi:MAG: 2-oxo acid dehydrogenase subunit E2 [Smithellaceae bacterium]|nr:2-oxo acid dehydrogenase subunit E2 [Syntrophaceae bacterium]MDD4240852.1 2-oxo acid dehydrogenase subunit E2 [Smithellaceae bacterium]NLX51716.1 2-oxo acid dehydrogenase subunit E2 [Deltaproteobacteria bacterium]
MGFRDRADGVLLTKISGFRKMWPYLMPTRVESTLYATQRIRLGNTLSWLEQTNAGREEKLTLFHVILAASVRLFALRPDLNRFVAGRRIYQRRAIDISFVVKREKSERGSETTLKLTFDPSSTIETVARQVAAAVSSTRESKSSHDENFANLLTVMPRFLIRSLIRFGRILDYFGLLPASYIRGDAMFASGFLSHLASINLDAAYHPLFEWGNTSFFLVVGKKKKEPAVSDEGELRIEEVMDLAFSLDHRVTTGVHFFKGIALYVDLLENPAPLMEQPQILPDPLARA